jgi:hypothetical protein
LLDAMSKHPPLLSLETDCAALSEQNRLAAEMGGASLDGTSSARIFRYFKTSPEIIRLKP